MFSLRSPCQRKKRAKSECIWWKLMIRIWTAETQGSVLQLLLSVRLLVENKKMQMKKCKRVCYTALIFILTNQTFKLKTMK